MHFKPLPLYSQCWTLKNILILQYDPLHVMMQDELAQCTERVFPEAIFTHVQLVITVLRSYCEPCILEWKWKQKKEMEVLTDCIQVSYFCRCTKIYDHLVVRVRDSSFIISVLVRVEQRKSTGDKCIWRGRERRERERLVIRNWLT